MTRHSPKPQRWTVEYKAAGTYWLVLVEAQDEAAAFEAMRLYDHYGSPLRAWPQEAHDTQEVGEPRLA